MNVSARSTLIYNATDTSLHKEENGEAHLLCDVKLRAVSVTQSKLLWAGQRPAKDKERKTVKR